MHQTLGIVYYTPAYYFRQVNIDPKDFLAARQKRSMNILGHFL
jgi:hypothetical protein